MEFVLRPNVFCGVLLLVICCWARAESCPPSFPLNPPAERSALGNAARALALLESVCLNRADYFAYRGLVALEQGEAGAAVEWLEHALLLNPDLPGVEVDFARALALTGDRPSAANLAGDLLDRPDLPSTLASWLPQQFRDWKGASDWISRFGVSTLAGYETNLNSAPQSAFVNITLGSGILQLQLAPQYQPRDGAAIQLGTSGLVGKEFGTDALVFIGQLQSRGSGQGDTNYLQGDVAALWKHSMESKSSLLRLDLIGLNYGSQDLYHSLRLESDLEWTATPCAPSVGLLYNSYGYPVSTELGGQSLSLLMGGSCEVGGGTLRGQLILGRDLAAGSNRPGGGEGLASMVLGWRHGLGRGSLDVQGILGETRDDGPYSPILAAGATRNITREFMRVEYSHPLGRGWEAVAYGEAGHQGSNIPLFSVNSQALYAGVRWMTQ